MQESDSMLVFFTCKNLTDHILALDYQILAYMYMYICELKGGHLEFLGLFLHHCGHRVFL